MCNRMLREKADRDGAVPQKVKMLGDRAAKSSVGTDISFSSRSREVGVRGAERRLTTTFKDDIDMPTNNAIVATTY